MEPERHDRICEHLEVNVLRGRADRLVRTALVGLVVGLSMFAMAGRAVAADNGTVELRAADEADFFYLALYPGASIDATAIVRNESSASVTLLSYPVDGESTSEGNFVLASQTSARVGVGAWVRMGAASITVPGNSDRKIPFRLSVPAGTPPGEYAGGLVVQTPPEVGKAALLSNGDSLRVDSVQRVGVRIYLTVAGTAVKSVDHGGLSWQRNGDAITFTLPVHNSGNTILHPVSVLSVSSWVGANTHLKFDAPESLLPGANLNMHARLLGAPMLQVGNAEATITSEAGIGHSRTSLFYAPWTLIVLTVFGVSIMLYVTWRIGRFIRRNRHLIDWS